MINTANQLFDFLKAIDLSNERDLNIKNSIKIHIKNILKIQLCKLYSFGISNKTFYKSIGPFVK